MSTVSLHSCHVRLGGMQDVDSNAGLRRQNANSTFLLLNHKNKQNITSRTGRSW